MMATFNKTDSFLLDIFRGDIDFTNTASAVPTIALTTAAEIQIAADSILANLTEINYSNLSARAITIASSAQTTGTYTLTFTDLVLTASGAVATFRGVTHYADVTVSPVDPLIMWYDHGSDVTLANGETFTIDYLIEGSGGFLQVV